MTDKQMYKLLNDFANDHSLAQHIKVDITHHNKSFKPRTEGSYARYEDCNLLASLILGAESFLMWTRRKNGR
uniref:Uncharacterized protein n=1 Tax=viral metagenome TaxID=1070528 RepID=A0A6M3XYF5_9ZZZZ